MISSVVSNRLQMLLSLCFTNIMMLTKISLHIITNIWNTGKHSLCIVAVVFTITVRSYQVIRAKRNCISELISQLCIGLQRRQRRGRNLENIISFANIDDNHPYSNSRFQCFCFPHPSISSVLQTAVFNLVRVHISRDERVRFVNSLRSCG